MTYLHPLGLSQPQFPFVWGSCGQYFPLCTLHTWWTCPISASLQSQGRPALLVLVGPRSFALFGVGTARQYNGELHMLFILVCPPEMFVRCALNTRHHQDTVLCWSEGSCWADGHCGALWVGCTQVNSQKKKKKSQEALGLTLDR